MRPFLVLVLLGLASLRLQADGLSEDVLKQVQEATVFIEVYYKELGHEEVRGPSTGSGLVVSEEGLILTNAHVAGSVYVSECYEEVAVPDATRAADRRVYVVSSIRVRVHSGTSRSRAFEAVARKHRPPR